MGAILGALIGNEFEKKAEERRHMANLVHPQALDYLTNPQSKITDSAGEFYVQQSIKHMPKSLRKDYQTFVDHQMQERQLRQSRAEANPPQQQFQSGSPAPQAQAVPNIPNVTAQQGAPQPSVPPPPMDVQEDQPSGFQGTNAPLPAPPDVSASAPARVDPAQAMQQLTKAAPQLVASDVLATPGQPAPVGSGFSSAVAPSPVSMPAPPIFQRGPDKTFLRAISPLQAVQQVAPAADYQAGEQRRLTDLSARSEHATSVDLAAQDRAVRIARLRAMPEFQKLSARQQTALLEQVSITPERAPVKIPTTMSGEDILTGNPNAVDLQGTPVQVGKHYRGEVDAEGNLRFSPPTEMSVQRKLVTDRNGNSFLVSYERTGAEIGREPVTDPRLIEHYRSTYGTTTEFKDIGGQIVPVTAPRSSTVQTGPVFPGSRGANAASPSAPSGPAQGAPLGAAPPRTAAAPVTLPPRPTASGRGVSVGAPLGPSGSEQRRLEEQPLLTDAAKNVRELEPMLSRIQRVKKAMEPFKNSTAPGTTFLPRLAYALGVDVKDLGGLLSEGEVDKLVSAGRIMKPSGSRSKETLTKALIHTPDYWKDSGKLLWEKIGAIETQVKETMAANKGPAAQKYPGLDRSRGGKPNVAPPPGAREPLDAIFQ